MNKILLCGVLCAFSLTALADHKEEKVEQTPPSTPQRKYTPIVSAPKRGVTSGVQLVVAENGRK